MEMRNQNSDRLKGVMVAFWLVFTCTATWGQDAQTLKKAQEGDAEAQFSMALTYLYEWDGVQKDETEYIKWLKLAAGNGHLRAQYELGHCHRDGEYGLPKDLNGFLKWTLASAKGGYSPAAYSLGLYYQHEGNDRDKAIYWYKKDIDLQYEEFGNISEHDTQALLRMGISYDPRTNPKARSLINPASISQIWYYVGEGIANPTANDDYLILMKDDTGKLWEITSSSGITHDEKIKLIEGYSDSFHKRFKLSRKSEKGYRFYLYQNGGGINFYELHLSSKLPKSNIYKSNYHGDIAIDHDFSSVIINYNTYKRKLIHKPIDSVAEEMMKNITVEELLYQ